MRIYRKLCIVLFRGIGMNNAWWICEDCSNGWSAMSGDNEVPVRCECGGKIKENDEDE